MPTNGVKFLSAFLSIASGITAAGADCTFSARRDDFLARESRLRSGVSATTLKLSRILPRMAAAPVSASIPHRNFIDDYIFGGLAARNVASARLTTDEEFFRRINLDLIGRIPDADAVRAFVADTTPSKRDDIVDRLLASSEFVDRWTM